MSQYDSSYQSLIEFESEYDQYRSSDLSETDTRSKILDKILINILGWNEFDIEREGYVRIGYFDYELKTSLFKFVVEAKKNFVEFKLPSTGNEVNIQTIYNGNKDVFDQLRGYLFERGLAYGVITNGTQFIIGRFSNSSGVDWKSEKCIYFKDFEDIKKNFVKFYELLSRESVAINGRIKVIQEDNTGKTIYQNENLKRKGLELVRNQISNQLIPVINKVFEEIYNTESLESKKILQNCYVSNDDVKKYNSELGHIFSDTPPSFDSRIVPVQNTKSTQDQIKKQVFDDLTNLPDPIILIGTAGAGKTTFIKYFTEIILDNKSKKTRPIVYIDFRLYTSQSLRDTKLIFRDIINQLEDVYPELNLNKISILKTIYKKQIAKKVEGTWSHLINKAEELNSQVSIFIEESIKDPIGHLQSISSYLINQCHKRLCIIFDNADQLNDDDQKEVFLLGNSINRNLKALVVISLREGYFYHWKNKPPFNAYQSIVYHITAPPYREVLRKRIDYVMKNFKFDTVKIETQNKNVEFSEGSLVHLFKNLHDTFFNAKNSEVLDFLEETSYPDIRQGLEKFKNFLLSGHSKISQYMSFDYGKGQGLPVWEFFKSVALGSNYYYDTSKSNIANLFYPSPSNRNHFTKIRILEYLHDKISTNSKKLEFHSINELISVFIKAGYSGSVIIEEVQELFDSHLLSTSEFSSDIESSIKINSDSNVAITAIGVYYLKTLLGKFYYLDLVLQDTPIYDDNSYAKLLANFPECDELGNRNLKQRKDTVESFLEYLGRQEMIDHARTESFQDNNALMKEIVKDINNKISTDFRSLDKALNKSD